MSFLVQPVTLQSLLGKDRKIGSITVNTVISEAATDTLTITKQPVQEGASITDHAFKEPTGFTMQVLFQDNIRVSLSKLYQNLLDLQTSRAPFDVITPKRIYKNVLISTLGQTTDKHTENVLAINITFQEIIIVKVGASSVARSNQKNPGATGATEKAGKKSFLKIAKEAVTG